MATRAAVSRKGNGDGGLSCRRQSMAGGQREPHGESRKQDAAEDQTLRKIQHGPDSAPERLTCA